MQHLQQVKGLPSLLSKGIYPFDCKKTKIQFIGAFSFTTLYAISDEVHQLLVPGRSGRVVDVFIDMQGVLLGMCAILLVLKILQCIRNIDKSK